MIEDLKKEIEVSKELLETLPKNNIKNRKKYKDTLQQVISDYTNLKEELSLEISKRHDLYCAITANSELTDKISELNFIKERLYLLNEYNTAYEKLNFDKILYNLNHFYNDNLDKVNTSILECVEIFRKAGINLTYKDFDFSEYARDYMKVLLETDDDDKIEECFEEIYWKCSNLLIHIELNIKHLYYKNVSVFEKYVDSLKDEYFENHNSNEIIERYQNLLIEYDNTLNNSINLGLEKFIKGEYNINDYQDTRIDKYCSYFSKNYKDDSDFYDNVYKLSNSTLEYKNYLYFEYIIEDLKKLYESAPSYKNNLKNKLKEIQKKEFDIYKLNRKLNRSKKDKVNIKILTLLDELEELYKQLDEDIFNDKIYKFVTEDSSIYDVLTLANSYFSYIVKCMNKYSKVKKYNEEQSMLTDYLLSPYNNIIKNIAISQDKDLPLIIGDKYKLSNLNITKDTLTAQSNIDEIIANAKKIKTYKNIVEKITYNRLKFLCDIKDLLP